MIGLLNKTKMYTKLCMLMLFVFYVCDGRTLFVSPPYSFTRILQHEASWQASQRNSPVVSENIYKLRVESKNVNLSDIEGKNKYIKHQTKVRPRVVPSFVKRTVQESLPKESNKRQTLDFRVIHPGSKETSGNGRISSSVLRNPRNQTSDRTSKHNRIVSREKERIVTNIAPVLPIDVCDRCPVDSQSKSTLTPCTCVGNTGTDAGLISITCPPSIHDLVELEGILTGTEYITSHVSRFTLQNSTVDGVLTLDLWGELDFKQICLDNNNITWVDKQAFIGSNETLHFLSLKNNSLMHFVSGSTNELPFLTSLDLSYNKLPFIETEAFSYKSLVYLSLSNNKIGDIGRDSFADLDSLVTLDLSNNELTQIGDVTFKFKNHTSITETFQIILSNNDITFISDGAFEGLHDVSIQLENNQLPTVREEVFQHIIEASISSLFYLSGNPIICDCDVFWIVDSTSVQSWFDNFMCTNFGKTIREVTSEELGNCTEVSNSYHERGSSLQYQVTLG